MTSKYVQFNFNIEPELREKMDQYVEEHKEDFEDVSSFLRKIIRQRIDPEKEEEWFLAMMERPRIKAARMKGHSKE
jgi:Arc/MetJ-type ribon-helix-helix transcriptional regulator